MFFKSVVDAYDGTPESKDRVFKRTYVRPKVEGEIKGKQNIKAAKRARVRAWKAEQEAK